MCGRDIEFCDLCLLLLRLHLNELSSHSVDSKLQSEHSSISSLLLRQRQTPEAVIVGIESRPIQHWINRIDGFEVLGH